MFPRPWICLQALGAIVGNTESCGLDGLPLAIEQAGAYILRTGRGFVDYKTFYEIRMLKLLDQQKAQKSRADNSDSGHRSVTTTWAINVEDLSVVAQMILDSIACFHPDRIPESLILNLVSIIEDGELEDDLASAYFRLEEAVLGEIVARFSLLNVVVEDDGKRSFSMHRLMRLVVQARHGGAYLMPAVCRALAAIHGECSDWEYQTLVDASHQERQHMFALVPHFDAIKQILDDFNMLNTQNLYFDDDIEGNIMVNSSIRRLSTASLIGASRRHSLHSLHEDDFESARARVSITSTINTPEMISQFAGVSRAIGYVYQFTARYADAINAYKVALVSFLDCNAGQDDVEIASTLQQLGHVFTSSNDDDRAVGHYKRALDMQRRLFGEGDHPTIASCLHRLATLLEQTGEVQEALQYYTASLEMKRRIHGNGNDHKEIASTLHRIGNLLQRMNQPDNALMHYGSSIEMLTRIHGKGVDHAGIAYSVQDSGEVLEQIGNLNGAMASYEKALAIRIRIYGKKAHQSTAHSAFCCGRAMMMASNF